MPPPDRRPAIAGAVLVGLVAAAWIVRRQLEFEWTTESLRELVDGFGLWGPALFVVLLGLRPILFIPSQILLIAAGLCFGAVGGTFWGALGVTLSGVLAFSLARWIGRDVVLARIPPTLRGVFDRAGRRSTLALVFFGTAYPFGPVTMYHAGAALAGAPVLGFLLSVAGGAVIRAFTYSYFGSRMVDGDLQTLLLTAAAVTTLLLLPMALPSSRRWLRERFLGAPEPLPPPGTPEP
jgi:uncharacterized membrane protein YdjX (TVP38/TMEM64 family)